MKYQSKQKIKSVGNSIYCISSRVIVPVFCTCDAHKRHTQSKGNLDYVLLIQKLNLIFLATLCGLLDFYASYLHFAGPFQTQYDFPPLREILNKILQH